MTGTKAHTLCATPGGDGKQGPVPSVKLVSVVALVDLSIIKIEQAEKFETIVVVGKVPLPQHIACL